MQADQPQPNNRFEALMAERDWSQTVIVAKVNAAYEQITGRVGRCNVERIRRIQRGVTTWPQLAWRLAFQQIFGVDSADQLGFYHSQANPSTSKFEDVGSLEREDDVRRGDFLRGAAAVAAAYVLLPGEEGPVPAGGAADARVLVDLPDTDIGIGDARRIHGQVSHYEQRWQEIGGGTLAGDARSEFSEAHRKLHDGEVDERAITIFASAAGNLATIAGWCWYDADGQVEANTCYRDALALGAFAGDDELVAHTCLNMALQTVNLSRRALMEPEQYKPVNPQFALRSVGRAADLSDRRQAGRIHALIAARAALAHACGQDTSSFQRAITSAKREMDLAYDHQALSDCPEWLRFVSHNEIKYHEAYGLVCLGQPARAAELFQQVVEARANQSNTAIYRAWLATSLTQSGDLDNGVATATQVVDALEHGVSSGRTLRFLGSVRKAASQPRHAAFSERYDRVVALHAGKKPTWTL